MDPETARVILVANEALRAASQATFQKIWRASALELACHTEIDAYEVSKAPKARQRFIEASRM